jgi:hypothetical protein
VEIPGFSRDPDSDLTRSREQDEAAALTLSTRIRVTLSELEKVRSQPGIGARYSDGHAHLSVFRFDDDMIVTPLLTHSVGHDAPTLHLRRYCRSRSVFWSAEDTRQYATTRPDASTAGSSTSHVPDGVWRTGTGIRPSFAHVHAVW